jgi:diguanylate cyclase (GGDEF)-like protein/PAS domain S-box-containing protein
MRPGKTSRTLTRLAAAVALAVTVLPPLGFFFIQREGLIHSLEADAKVQAIVVSDIVGRNPRIWNQAHERLKEGIEPIRDNACTTRIVDDHNRLITAATAELKWPTIVRSDEFFDSGFAVGRVEVIASIASILQQSILVFAISATLGFFVFVPLRKMPAQALKRASESLVRGELSRSLVDGLSAGVVLTDDQLQVLAFNRSATSIAGLTQPIAPKTNLLDCFEGAIGDDGSPFAAEHWPMRLALDGGASAGPATVGLRTAEGRPVWLSVRSMPIRHGEENENTAIVTSIEDITEQKDNADRLLITERAVQSSHDAIMITDAELRIISVNDAFCTITGYESDEVLGQMPRILQRSAQHEQDFYDEIWARLSDTGSWNGEVWDQRRDGEAYPAWLSLSEIRDPGGRLTHYVGTIFDLSERLKAEQDARRLALHDSLTGLPNRTYLRESLSQALAAAQRHEWRVGVYFIDLDHFKLINDTMGHQVGDQVLCEVARRLKSVLRDEDTVGRLAGDEFVAFTPNVDSDAAFVTVAEHVLQVMNEPFAFDNDNLFVTPSIGVVVYPDDGADIDALLSNADTAMYAAKADGRANFKFFTEEMNESGRHQIETTRAVKHALELNEFVLFYQPKVLASNYRQITGTEALIRWNHPQRGLVPPGQFIPVIEGTRLIIEVGNWVLNEALRQAREWRQQGIPVCISINVSPLQFQQQDFVPGLRRLAERHGFVAGSIRLEVTENLMLTNPEATIEKMSEIHELGFLLSLDDFGTGYSNLGYLARFPFDELKIDRSFVCRLTHERTVEDIITAIIVLSHALGLQTVAEGVETDAEADALRRLGCDQIQGYLYGRPEPACDFAARMRAASQTQSHPNSKVTTTPA